MTDTDIWFKTREMQQTDLGKQMVQLQKDIKQMSKVLLLILALVLKMVLVLLLILALVLEMLLVLTIKRT